MFSKNLINTQGQQLNIYGLEEYKLLPEGTPLVVLFFISGDLQKETQEDDVEQACQNICMLNEYWTTSGQYLILIRIDQPKSEPRSITDNRRTDAQFYYSAKSTTYAISNIIENFDSLVFGENSISFVNDWGVIGISSGGIIAEFAASFEPKITTVIIMACSLDVKRWFPRISNALGLETDLSFQRVLASSLRSMAFDLRSKKLLVVNKSKDEIAPGSINEYSLDELRRIHTGREGHDWKSILLSGNQHIISEDYIVKAKEWTSKWLVSNGRYNFAKI